MGEQTTELSLVGLIGLVIGVLIVFIFFGLVFVNKILTSVSDSKQTEQFTKLFEAIVDVCGDPSHPSKSNLYITVYEGYRIAYKDHPDEFDIPDHSRDLVEKMCPNKCMCLFHMEKPIHCTSLTKLDKSDCRNMKIQQWVGRHLLPDSKEDLSFPRKILGIETDFACKYRINIYWEDNNVVLAGEAQKLTTSPGKGGWGPWWKIGMAEC